MNLQYIKKNNLQNQQTNKPNFKNDKTNYFLLFSNNINLY